MTQIEKRMRRWKEVRINRLEQRLNVQFPQSYREFLLNREEIEGKAGFRLPVLGLLPEPEKEEKKEEEGTLLSFQPGDPRRGGFAWIATHQGRIVGLCTLLNCHLCNLKDRERLKDFQGGELKVNLIFYQRETKEFYIAHLVSFPKKEIKGEEPKLSALKATEFLRNQRPDLKDKPLSCVRLIGDWAVCLDLREKPEEDCPLVTLNLKNKEIPITQTNPSFKGAIEESIRDYQRALAAKQRVANRREEVEGIKGRKFSHIRKKGEPYPIQPGPRDWHPLIRRAHDDVVGRTAFRYNTRLDALEVDEFYAPDHPEYKEGEPLRSLLCSIFCWARELGGSLNIVFSQDLREDDFGKIVRTPEEATRMVSQERYREIIDRNRRPRLPRPVPLALVELAKKYYGISFEKEEEGKISHQEGVKLFFALLEFPDEIQRKVEELEKAGYLSKEMISEIISAGIWTKEEAVWFFLNVPRPEAIILGTDVPESRLLYSESAHYGRAVYLTSLLKQKILVDLSDGLSEEERTGIDCKLEPREDFWLLKANQEFHLPWQIKGSEPVVVQPEEPVLILSRPQQTSQPDYDKVWLREDIEFLAKVENGAKIRCFLLSFEFSDLKYGMKISEEMKEISREAAEKGVYLLFSPFKLDILSDEVEERMAKARRLKHFESRSCPLELWLIEVPKEVWQEPALRYSVEDALSAASWIVKKIDLRLGRIRFRTNCQVIERIALQDPRNKQIAEFDAKESEELLEVLKSEQGITLPFVQPEKMPEFLEKLGKKVKSILDKVQGGIVVLVPPYEKSIVEPKVKPIEKSVITSVPPDFQFPVNPEDIDLSRYQQGYREDEMKRFHEQIQTALRTGQPLAVSYLPHELFPEVMRDYIYYSTHTEYQEKPFLLFFKQRVEYEKREPPDPTMLRISYQDGTEGEPFPLFCLSEPKNPLESTNFYEFKIGSISMRHVNLDLITEGYLMTNMMMKRKGRESAASQEDYAFRMTWHFLTNFIDLVQHKRVEEITQEVKFRFLWNWLKEIRERSYEGLELHIFQTGLEPGVVGIYRAVIEFLKQRRGELIVIPRLISHRDWRKLREEKGIKGITDNVYLGTKEWF